MIKTKFSLRPMSYTAPVCDYFCLTGQLLCESDIPEVYHEGGADGYDDDDIVDNGGY